MEAIDDARLDVLPVEVLQTIASFLPCSSILNLSFSNRRLFGACYDRAVFKQAAVDALYADRYTHLPSLETFRFENDAFRRCDEISLSSGTTTEVDSEDEWYPEPEGELTEDEDWDFNDWGPDLVQRRALPHQEWVLSWPRSKVSYDFTAPESARIALAVEKAQKYFNVSLEYQSKDLTQRWIDEGWIDWLPQLIALGHGSCLELKPWTFTRLLFEPGTVGDPDKDGWGRRNPSSSDYVAVGFCMLTLLLIWVETKPVLPAGADDVHVEDISGNFCIPEPFGYSILEDLDWLLKEPYHIEDFDLDDRYSVILRLLFSTWYKRRSHHTPYPSVHRLPFASTLGSPIPFSTPAGVFTRCCPSGLELTSYLDGDWLGWCRDSGRYQGHPIPPPSENIHFKISHPHPPYASSIAALISSATGNDAWGAFTLEGTVSTDGEVSLKKVYAEQQLYFLSSEQGATYRYRGGITPFGISGMFEKEIRYHTCGLRRQPEGHFWFWKKDWSLEWPITARPE